MNEIPKNDSGIRYSHTPKQGIHIIFDNLIIGNKDQADQITGHISNHLQSKYPLYFDKNTVDTCFTKQMARLRPYGAYKYSTCPKCHGTDNTYITCNMCNDLRRIICPSSYHPIYELKYDRKTSDIIFHDIPKKLSISRILDLLIKTSLVKMVITDPTPGYKKPSKVGNFTIDGTSEYNNKSGNVSVTRKRKYDRMYSDHLNKNGQSTNVSHLPITLPYTQNLTGNNNNQSIPCSETNILLLQTYIYKLHNLYKTLVIYSATYQNQNNRIYIEVRGEDERFCIHKNDYHKSNGVYFILYLKSGYLNCY